MPKALRDVNISSFFLAQSSCYYFNLIAFIISIETEASLLALAKSICYLKFWAFCSWQTIRLFVAVENIPLPQKARKLFHREVPWIKDKTRLMQTLSKGRKNAPQK